MTVAALAKEIPLTPLQAIPMYAAAACLCLASIFAVRKMLGGIRSRGGKVRSDLFGLPDFIVVGIFIILIVLALAMKWLLPSSTAGDSGLQLIGSVLFLSLPVILALLLARGIQLPVIFGLKNVTPLRALGVAAGIVALLLPALMVIAMVTAEFLGGHPEQQEVVTKFREATKAGKNEIVWQMIIWAAFVAPLVEEFLFRGYFYPVLKRITGPVPAALCISNAGALPPSTIFFDI